MSTLSQKEIAVCKLLCCGLENLHIADVINRSVKTIEKHRQSCYRKLDVRPPSPINLLRRALAEKVITFQEWLDFVPPDLTYKPKPRGNPKVVTSLRVKLPSELPVDPKLQRVRNALWNY